MINSRRKFLKNTFSVFSTTFLAPNLFAKNIDKSNLDIGLQMYSFAPLIMQGKFDLLGFPDLVKNTYGINGMIEILQLITIKNGLMLQKILDVTLSE